MKVSTSYCASIFSAMAFVSIAATSNDASAFCNEATWGHGCADQKVYGNGWVADKPPGDGHCVDVYYYRSDAWHYWFRNCEYDAETFGQNNPTPLRVVRSDGGRYFTLR